MPLLILMLKHLKSKNQQSNIIVSVNLFYLVFSSKHTITEVHFNFTLKFKLYRVNLFEKNHLKKKKVQTCKVILVTSVFFFDFIKIKATIHNNAVLYNQDSPKCSYT